MTENHNTLTDALRTAVGERTVALVEALGETTLTIRPRDLLAVTATLRDAPELRFEQLIDLCGVDYLTYGD
ncbi:MAG TPA: NADH-quinone oxidoreductase subunit C, partial [Burkholderiales bacterium]|nr:NADH-quinone oxidoreductase subunit C [Burkholderiales bacterium]